MKIGNKVFLAFLVVLMLLFIEKTIFANKEEISNLSKESASQITRQSQELPSKPNNITDKKQPVDGREFCFYVLIVALFAITPIILDVCLAHWRMGKTIKQLGLTNQNVTNLADLRKILQLQPPTINGLARSMMALTILVIIGVAVFYILANSDGSQKDNQILNNVLSILSGTLAAITGFYFGGRATEKSVKEEKVKNLAVQPHQEIRPL